MQGTATHTSASCKYLLLGDEIKLETAAGATLRYRVTETQVLDADNRNPTDPTGPSRLTLVTCYPFDSIVPGGRLRCVVTAEAIDAIAIG